MKRLAYTSILVALLASARPPPKRRRRSAKAPGPLPVSARAFRPAA